MSTPETDTRDICRVTVCGMAVNVAVALVKGAAGLLANSQALVADAVHSISDLATDCAVLFGVRYWEAPADDDHPYGHGKIQGIVTLFIGALLLLVAWELGLNAVETLRSSDKAVPGHAAFFAAIVSIVAKELVYRQTMSVAARVKSPALAANAWHHRSDAISSIPVAVAVAIAHFWPGLSWVDSVGALIVSAFIVRVAWEIAKPALAELIDSGVREKSAAIEKIAAAVPGVRAVHKVRAHRFGGSFQTDLHIKVDPALSVAQGHALGHAVKSAILNAGLDIVDALVHVEPADPA